MIKKDFIEGIGANANYSCTTKDNVIKFKVN